MESSQTGSLAKATGLDVSVITVTEPTPEPVDPTGGVRATNQTGMHGVNQGNLGKFSSFPL